ncbi:MAG: FtsH protease activity modulator HflK [Gammaproteobacteria bacterium]|nr:MAG: FtsH protease activity modulator HflK [Gammaproteobacteria bacterium]
MKNNTTDNDINDMSWNEPGNSGGKDPWGGGSGRRPDRTPQDLDEALGKLAERLKGMFGGGGGGSDTGGSSVPGGGSIFGIIFLVLVAWVVYDGVYTIKEAERGVVLRFGEYVATLQPGLSFRFPRPIEEVYRVNVKRVRSAAIGSTKAESLMLTQDENIIDIKFTVQYVIQDPRRYLFNVREPDLTLVQATESAVREIIGRSTMDYVITEGRGDISAKSKILIQDIIDRYQTGLQVTEFNMQAAQPPDEVQDAFADAVKAQADEERFKNEAEGYARDVVGRAEGTKQRVLLDADAYRQQKIENATGEAKRFVKLLKEYKKAPRVTRERLYIETIEGVMSNTTKIMVDSSGSNNLLYLPFDKLMQRSASESSGTPLVESRDSMSPSSLARGDRSSRGAGTDRMRR